METYSRKSAFTEMKEFDHLAKPGDFMEVTLWHNGEGFDVTISDDQLFTLSWGEYKALKKLVKAADQ
jgi:hypothetical protein